MHCARLCALLLVLSLPRVGGADDLRVALSALAPADAAALLASLGEAPAAAAAAPASCASETLTLPDAAALHAWQPPVAAQLLEVGGGGGGVGVGGGGDGGAAASASSAMSAAGDLDCTCTAAACDCDKSCFCGVRASPYAGHRRVPPEGLSGLGAAPPDHDCACTLGEVGGLSVADMSNTIDCDCQMAACECKRSCTCTAKAAPAPAPTPPP